MVVMSVSEFFALMVAMIIIVSVWFSLRLLSYWGGYVFACVRNLIK